MVTRQSKRSSFSAQSQDRVQQTAQQAGIAAAFGQAADLGPQVLALQQSLLAGVVQSQRREAKRLAQLYGEDDARIARAVERAAQVSQLHAQAQSQAAVVSRVVQTFQQDGIFHGYVHHSDGAPAVGYAVKLEMPGTSDKKQLQRGAAETDDTGYFRIDLTGTSDNNQQDSGKVRRWTERLARLVAGEVAGEEQQEEAHASTAAAPDKPPTGVAPGEPATSSRVEVLDPSGRVVFEDPDPPTFDAAQSEFRYYVIADADNTRSTRATGKKPSSGTRR
jgi:hypothetical protein